MGLQSVRRIALSLAGALAAATVLGCGGSSSASSTDSAVNVAGTPISRATVEHWTHVEAIVARQQNAQTPPPAGSIPDPPNFTACSTFLAKLYASKVVPSSPTKQTLKAQCASEFRHQGIHALEILIDYEWSRDVGKERGIVLTPREVDAVLTNQYPNEETIRKVLAINGETRADLRLLAERTLLAQKLLSLEEAAVDAKHPASKKLREEQLLARATAFTQKWKSRTDCKPGYVMELCRQYKGPATLVLP